MEDYIKLMHERPELFRESEIYPIVNPETEPERIKEYEERTGQKIGIVYKSKFHLLVVDLVKGDPDFAYERLLTTVNGKGVVIVPVYKGKFIMLNQFRHSIREEQICFPRGFASDVSQNVNVKKELEEELNATLLCEPTQIGEITTDSGILSDKVNVYVAEIEKWNSTGEEGIIGAELYSESQMDFLIKTGTIADNFTVSAYLFFKLRQGEMSELERWGY